MARQNYTLQIENQPSITVTGGLKDAKRLARKFKETVWLVDLNSMEDRFAGGCVHPVKGFEFGFISAITGTYYTRGFVAQVRGWRNKVSDVVELQPPIRFNRLRG